MGGDWFSTRCSVSEKSEENFLIGPPVARIARTPRTVSMPAAWRSATARSIRPRCSRSAALNSETQSPITMSSSSKIAT